MKKCILYFTVVIKNWKVKLADDVNILGKRSVFMEVVIPQPIMSLLLLLYSCYYTLNPWCVMIAVLFLADTRDSRQGVISTSWSRTMLLVILWLKYGVCDRPSIITLFSGMLYILHTIRITTVIISTAVHIIALGHKLVIRTTNNFHVYYMRPMYVRSYRLLVYLTDLLCQLNHSLTDHISRCADMMHIWSYYLAHEVWILSRFCVNVMRWSAFTLQIIAREDKFNFGSHISNSTSCPILHTTDTAQGNSYQRSYSCNGQVYTRVKNHSKIVGLVRNSESFESVISMDTYSEPSLLSVKDSLSEEETYQVVSSSSSDSSCASRGGGTSFSISQVTVIDINMGNRQVGPVCDNISQGIPLTQDQRIGMLAVDTTTPSLYTAVYDWLEHKDNFTSESYYVTDEDDAPGDDLSTSVSDWVYTPITEREGSPNDYSDTTVTPSLCQNVPAVNAVHTQPRNIIDTPAERMYTTLYKQDIIVMHTELPAIYSEDDVSNTDDVQVIYTEDGRVDFLATANNAIIHIDDIVPDPGTSVDNDFTNSTSGTAIMDTSVTDEQIQSMYEMADAIPEQAEGALDHMKRELKRLSDETTDENISVKSKSSDDMVSLVTKSDDVTTKYSVTLGAERLSQTWSDHNEYSPRYHARDDHIITKPKYVPPMFATDGYREEDLVPMQKSRSYTLWLNKVKHNESARAVPVDKILQIARFSGLTELFEGRILTVLVTGAAYCWYRVLADRKSMRYYTSIRAQEIIDYEKKHSPDYKGYIHES